MFFSVYLPLPPQQHGDFVGATEYLPQARDPDTLGQGSGDLGLQRAKVSVKRRMTLMLLDYSGLRSSHPTRGEWSPKRFQ